MKKKLPKYLHDSVLKNIFLQKFLLLLLPKPLVINILNS